VALQWAGHEQQVRQRRTTAAPHRFACVGLEQLD
jgi:hypothetical protein